MAKNVGIVEPVEYVDRAGLPIYRFVVFVLDMAYGVHKPIGTTGTGKHIVYAVVARCKAQHRVNFERAVGDRRSREQHYSIATIGAATD